MKKLKKLTVTLLVIALISSLCGCSLLEGIIPGASQAVTAGPSATQEGSAPDVTGQATQQSTQEPTPNVTQNPTTEPTDTSAEPSALPTEQPGQLTQETTVPSEVVPSNTAPLNTLAPIDTERPIDTDASLQPTNDSTVQPVETPPQSELTKPTQGPSIGATPTPSELPTVTNTKTPIPEPDITTPKPTATPTATPKPTATPTVRPTATPTVRPTATPTVRPTATPTVKPTATPTVKPTATPTVKPTATPTVKPTATPTVKPTATPSQNTQRAAAYCRGQLDTNRKAIYDAIVEACKNPNVVDNYITVNMSVAYNDDAAKYASPAMNAILMDHPEFFFIGNSWGVTSTSSRITKIKIQTIMDNAQIATAKTQMEQGVKYYTDKVSWSLSDYETSKKLYELMATRVSYDLDAQNAHNLIGSLVGKSCVCEGYAEAYQYLLNLYGIQAFTVTGQATNSSGRTEGHKWVAVKLDGAWYFTDPTWGDLKGDAEVIAEGHTKVSYAYLNVDAARLGVSHVLDDETKYFTDNLTFTATANNYYVKDGGDFASADTSAMEAFIKADIKEAVSENRHIVSLRLKDSDGFQSAYDYVWGNINSIYKKIKAEVGKDISFALYKNSKMFVVEIWLKY